MSSYLSIRISIGPPTVPYIVVIHTLISLTIRPSMQPLAVLPIVPKSTLVKPTLTDGTRVDR